MPIKIRRHSHEMAVRLESNLPTSMAVLEKLKYIQRRLQMIAQRTKTNNGVVSSNDATVQTSIKLFPQNRALMFYRWECEVCGMVHTGPMPAACD